MGAACQKQFDNIGGDYEYEQEYEKQKQRFSINSIKVQHQQFRPNSKNVSLGMIDSLFHSQNNQAYNKSFYEPVDGMSVLSPRRSALGGTVNQNPRPTTIAGKQLDQQQLHDTHRPFQNRETIFLGDQQQLFGKQEQKIREPLDLSFYYSLGLPQYNYPAYPANVAKQFENLFVSEQEDRNGVRYIGEWKDNKTIHGNGVMQSNTIKYIGQFNNGLKHYHGRQIQKNEVYEGHFAAGRRKGYGIRYSLDSVEEGQFDNYLIKGKISYKNGNFYEGSLNKNQYHGQGTFINQQKNTIYQGNFRNGKLHGQGKIIVNGTLVYEGNFEQNYRHGKGRYNWNSSEYYLGQYCRDKKHGFGQLVQGNKRYTGTFVNGHLQGLIKVESIENKQIQQHLFKNGVRMEDQDEQFSFSESEGMPAEWARVVKKSKLLYPNRLDFDDIEEEEQTKRDKQRRFTKFGEFNFQSD